MKETREIGPCLASIGIYKRPLGSQLPPLTRQRVLQPRTSTLVLRLEVKYIIGYAMTGCPQICSAATWAFTRDSSRDKLDHYSLVTHSDFLFMKLLAADWTLRVHDPSSSDFDLFFPKRHSSIHRSSNTAYPFDNPFSCLKPGPDIHSGACQKLAHSRPVICCHAHCMSGA